MSKKYVIEINPEYEDATKGVMVLGARESNLYVDTLSIEDLEELNSDYINEHYGELQDEAYQRGINDGSLDVKQRVEGAYQRGLDDAWETARALVWDTSISEYETAGVKVDDWGVETCEVLRRYPAHEAVELLRTINHIRQPKLDFQSDIELFVNNANEAITELAKKFVENMKDMYK